MSISTRPAPVSHSAFAASPAPLGLPQPVERVPATQLVQLCYTLVHAAEAVGIRDLADGEFAPGDTTLEQGIELTCPPFPGSSGMLGF